MHTYTQHDPDIILINSHGIPHNETFKIHGYSVHRKNDTNTHTDGTAIAIKHNITYRLLDDFISDTLAIEVETHRKNHHSYPIPTSCPTIHPHS